MRLSVFVVFSRLSLFSLLFTSLAVGSDISPATVEALAAKLPWRVLLQYPQGAGHSDLGESFFLSENGSSDPQAELLAIVDALDTPGSNIRCRFPGRTLWLARQLDRPDWLQTECARLEEWARFDDVEGISLILVSGYLGNPASSFGHSLMKVRYQGENRRSHLMGLGINFGAKVPDYEPMFLYITRGLFGGYQAAFSDDTFYAHDQTYTRSEFRDLWEYPLELDDDNVKLIIYALWELRDQRFDYYFLTKNCGYRLAQLVELATGEDLVDGVRGWYLPVELFLDIDPRHYGEPIFHPSSQRVLIARIKSLSASGKQAVKQAVELQIDSAPADAAFAPLDGITDTEQTLKALDAMLAYYEFQDMAEKTSDNSPWKIYRDEALRRRFPLPVSDYRPAQPDSRLSAKDTDKPASLRLAAGRADGENVMLLNYQPVNFDAISYTDLLGSELEVLDISVGINEDDDWFLQEFTLARVTRIADADDNIPGYWPISWKGSVGWKPETYTCFDCDSFYVTGGLGLARGLSSRWLYAGFVNLQYLQSIDSVFAELELKMVNHSNELYSLESGLKYGTKSPVDREFTLAFVNARVSIARDLSVKLNVANYLNDDFDHQVQLGIDYRF